jgi:hypothetical protein
MTLIASIDGPNRNIHLHADTVGADVHPMDIYREGRTLRRTDLTLRKYKNFMSAFGNVDKGGSKFTERYVRLNDGTRIVPYDVTQELTITGTIITDTGQEGIACFDKTPLTIGVAVDINYVPPQVEIILVNTGGGSGGATAQEVWEYANRTLTSSAAPTVEQVAAAVWTEASRSLTTAAGVTAQDILDISAQVWLEASRTLTSAIGPTASQISDAVWAAVTRTLTSASGPDAATIAVAVWSETTRLLTVQAGLSPTQNTQLMALPLNPVLASDVRLDRGMTIGQEAKLDAVPTNPVLTDDVRLDRGMTTAQENVLNAIPSNPVLTTDVRLDRGMTIAQEAKLDALPTASAISAAVWNETVRDLTIAAGLTPSQETQLQELWQLQGLDINNPMTVTQTTRIAAAISLLFTGDGVNTTTSTRQP